MSTRLQIMGSRIRTARQFRRLTGEQLAEKIGIAVDSLRHIENGVRSPSFQLIERISDILDVSLDYLAGKTDSPLEHRVRKELENSGLTKEQEDAIVELALNSIPIIKNTFEQCTCRSGRCNFIFHSPLIRLFSRFHSCNMYSLDTIISNLYGGMKT